MGISSCLVSWRSMARTLIDIHLERFLIIA